MFSKKFVIQIEKEYFYRWFLIVLLLIPHFNPPLLNILGVLGDLFDVIRLISFSIIILLVFLNRILPSKVTFLIVIQQLYVIIITWLNGYPIKDSLLEMGNVMAVVLLFDLLLQSNEWEVFTDATLTCFEIVIFINLITIILFPNGMYWTNDIKDTFFVNERNWFLGYYNNLTKYVIPAYLFILLYIEETGKKIKGIFLLICMILSAFLLKSGGLTVSLLTITAIWLFLKNRTVIFNYYTYWISQIIFIVVFVFVGLNIDLFSWFLRKLGKTSSFLGRMKLWGNYTIQISSSPIFGNGISNMNVRQGISGMNWGQHAHNLILEILYRGGLVNMLLWVIIIMTAGRRIYKYRNNINCKIVATCFAGWCVDAFVEPFMSSFLMGMFVVAYYVGMNEEIGIGISEPTFDSISIPDLERY